MPVFNLKPIIPDITFFVVTPDDVAYTQGAARRGCFPDLIQVPLWTLRAPIWRIRVLKLQGDSSFAAKVNRYSVTSRH